MITTSKTMSVAPSRALSIASSELKAQTRQLADRQIVTDLTKSAPSNTSVTPVAPGEVISFIPVPPKITVTVTNTNAAGGALEIKLFNNDTYDALPAGVVVSNGSGFGGKFLDKMIANINNGNGLLTYGFNVTAYDSTGTKSDSVLNAAGIEARYFKGYGSSYIPVEIDVAGAERNTQFKDGLLTVKVMLMLNWNMQLKVTLGQLEKLQFVFFTQPIQD